MRKFTGIDFMTEAVPDETTLCKLFFDAINRVMLQTGRMMKGGTIVDATIINAPSSTKNAEKKRDPEMHQTKKGNEWKFGMKCHIGVDAAAGWFIPRRSLRQIHMTSRSSRVDSRRRYGGYFAPKLP